MADVNKQTEEMLSPDDMMLDSEPVTNEQLVEAGKDLGQFALESTPIVGEAIIAKDIGENISEGDYLSAGLNTAALGVGALPIVGDVLNKPLRAAAKKFSKVDTVDETVDTMTAAGLDADAVDNWRKTNATSEDFRKSLKGRNPILIDLANARKANEITAKEYREAADAFRPIRTVQDVPEPATTTELVSALGKKSEKGVLGVNRSIPDGDRITARLDINAYTDYDVWIPTLTHPDKKTMYSPTVVLRDVSFIQPDDKAVGMALNVATGKAKAPFAVMEGNYQSMPDSDAFEYAKKVFDDAEWTQVGYDPTRRGFFYDRKTGQPVLNAEEVVQVGHLVLAKNAVKGNADDFLFNEGGVVPMKEQMEMFEDGGLMQEGGTVDPVSGNDVPVGSTQEEVRDDIPAQLSEGEFVFPADVVRFYGLEKLMEMRQRAKAGLQMMEDMGQMGNSEEATLPDDIPFDLEDLDIEDEMGDNNELEMQVGGFVQPQGFTGIQSTQPSQFQNYQPQYVPYQAPVVTAAYQSPQQQAVPTIPTGQLPQAEQFLQTPQPGEQDLRKYVNDEGQVRMIPFVNDQPIYPIPQGFYPEAEKPVEEEAAPAPVTTETTRVTDRGGRDTGDTTPGATMSFGGSKDRTGRISGTMTGNISYSGFPGGIPGILGAVGRVTGLTDALQLSEGQTATLSNVSVPEGLSTRDVLGNQSITFNADTFNTLNKADVTSNERKEVEEYLDKIGKLFGNVKKDLNLSYEDAKNIVDLQEAEAAKETRTEAQLSAAQAARERYQAAQAKKQKQDKGNGGGFESSGRAGAEAAARDLGVGMATRGKAKGGVATKKMKRGGLASKK